MQLNITVKRAIPEPQRFSVLTLGHPISYILIFPHLLQSSLKIELLSHF